MNEYEIVGVVEGSYASKDIRIAQWAIRDGKVLTGARKVAGAAFTLTVERYDAHPELEGERLLSDSETSTLPLYYRGPIACADGLQLVTCSFSTSSQSLCCCITPFRGVPST